MSEAPLIYMGEDNDSDIELVRMALDELGCMVRINTARNGEEALNFLRTLRSAPGPATHPDVILLDLNMPRVGGIEILTYLSQHQDLRSIPVVILTTSDSPRDRATCLRLGAFAYIVKARRFGELVASLAPVVDLVQRSGGGQPATSPRDGRH
jgi:CheY-like chemotaxis protein